MPVFVYILIGIALLLFLLLISKIKVFLSYEESLNIYAKFLFFKINIVPSKPRNKKKKATGKEVAQKKDDGKKGISGDTKPKEKSPMQRLFDVREALLILIKRFLGRLHFRFIVLKVNVATENAATTALLYGAINQGVSYLLETLKTISKVDVTKKSDISVTADFLSQKTDFKAKIVLYLHFISLVYVGIHAIKTYFKIKSTKEDKHGTDKAK